MHRLRCQLPQCLLPSWGVSWCRQVQCRQAKSWPSEPTALRCSSSSTTAPRSKKTAVPLFDELFPEKAKKNSSDHRSYRPKEERSIPPLPLLPDLADLDTRPGRHTPEGVWIKQSGYLRGRIRKISADAEQRQELTVLILRGASKSLCEDDFRRATPSGKHIDGWRGEGDFLKSKQPLLQRFSFKI